MASNGYTTLTEGPEAGWLGFYSLNKQGKLAGTSLASLIAGNISKLNSINDKEYGSHP